MSSACLRMAEYYLDYACQHKDEWQSLFFALPELEQARLWQEAHLAAEQEMNNHEQPVRLDALPSRLRAMRAQLPPLSSSHST